MPCLGLTVLIPALAPGDAAWEWDVMARSIPAGTGTRALLLRCSWKLQHLQPRGRGWCCEENRLGLVLFGIGVESATCWGKEDEEQCW